MRAAKRRRRRDAWIGAAVAAFVGVVVRLVDPRTPGHYPTCPVRALTGLACPGCGSLRATADLVHGDLLAALDHNVLLIVVLPVALGAWIRSARGLPSRPRPWVAPVVAATLLLWTVARNLRLAPFTILAP